MAAKTASDASDAFEPRAVLKRCFGYDSFRPNQEQIVDALLDGRDVLAVMPTGAGKSVCYQVPALCLAERAKAQGQVGFTLVVSPLISLMADQVRSLNAAGISAAFVNSSLSSAEQNAALEGAAQGAYVLLYVAPERLETPQFARFCAAYPPAMVAVDEAHCISQWGQDFRPSYTHISDFVEGLPVRPVLCAFTATATKAVRADIAHALNLRDPLRVTASFDRPNLHFAVRRATSSGAKGKDAQLMNICREHAGQSGIVYCTSRRAVEQVCDKLQDEGFSATRYHAGLTPEERAANQDDFVYDRVQIIVATNAFGMGIDKSNVSFVVHYNMPLDLESYYQEAGRAGRDGEPADCTLLYAPKDVHTCEFLLNNSFDDATDLDASLRERLRARAKDRLKMMTFYSTTTDCLRQFILRYFDESAPGFCGNCSNCETNFVPQDVTLEANKIISCVARLGQRGRCVGRSTIVDILRGSKAEKMHTEGYDSLSTYGIMADDSTKHVREVLDGLVEKGILDIGQSKYPVVVFTQKAADFLHQKEDFELMLPQPKAPAAARAGAGTEASPDPVLFAKLKELRAELAAQANIPAYMVFSNHTLHEMCRKKPRTHEDFLQVSGVGAAKDERWGEAFLEAINE
ncbi:MAG: DNA helicase RecQ [Coriobacteriales bacterium]|nr:DNA helicase RecQ [Coriobacteriaceae bacterium]MDY2722912.1 DNA helicase RecQ [Coriobacteriales bacterium]